MNGILIRSPTIGGLEDADGGSPNRLRIYFFPQAAVTQATARRRGDLLWPIPFLMRFRRAWPSPACSPPGMNGHSVCSSCREMACLPFPILLALQQTRAGQTSPRLPLCGLTKGGCLRLSTTAFSDPIVFDLVGQASKRDQFRKTPRSLISQESGPLQRKFVKTQTGTDDRTGHRCCRICVSPAGNRRPNRCHEVIWMTQKGIQTPKHRRDNKRRNSRPTIGSAPFLTRARDLAKCRRNR